MTEQGLKDVATNLAKIQAETTRRIDVIERRLDAICQTGAASYSDLLFNHGIDEDVRIDPTAFFFNSLQAKPVLGGVRYDDVFLNVHSFNGKLQNEYDVVMVNSKSVALIEVKYAVHPDDIDKTIKGIANYRTLFPQHKDFDIYGAIAGFKIGKDVEESAKQQGLMVLKRVGDVMEVDAGEPHKF